MKLATDDLVTKFERDTLAWQLGEERRRATEAALIAMGSQLALLLGVVNALCHHVGYQIPASYVGLFDRAEDSTVAALATLPFPKS